MKSSVQLLEEIIRAETALHLKLVAYREAGRITIGGSTPRTISDLIAETDASIATHQGMLACLKDES